MQKKTYKVLVIIFFLFLSFSFGEELYIVKGACFSPLKKTLSQKRIIALCDAFSHIAEYAGKHMTKENNGRTVITYTWKEGKISVFSKIVLSKKYKLIERLISFKYGGKEILIKNRDIIKSQLSVKKLEKILLKYKFKIKRCIDKGDIYIVEIGKEK